jgi:hypothetical protein
LLVTFWALLALAFPIAGHGPVVVIARVLGLSFAIGLAVTFAPAAWRAFTKNSSLTGAEILALGIFILFVGVTGLVSNHLIDRFTDFHPIYHLNIGTLA